MTLLLAGDIGGTKTILWLVNAQTSSDTADIKLSTLYEQRYASHDFFDLVPMVQQFLAAAAPTLDPSSEDLSSEDVPQLDKACFAIAGPVVGNTSKLTNLGWSLTAERLTQELQISQVSLINDFAAVGYGVLGLAKDDLCTLQVGKPEIEAPIAVIGAGTGLGQGFLIHRSGHYQVFSSEGGHADFAPRSELEFQLLHYLQDKHDLERVSVERVVSGQGIVAIYQFLRDRQPERESPNVGEVIRAWEREAGREEKTIDPAAVISQAALKQRDRLSEQTMQLFMEAYGAEAGNLALKLLPYGGLYVAGGIAAKNMPLVQEGSFLRTFLGKGRMRPLMERIPVHLVLNPQVGLIGAARVAARL
ncbi:MAG: glucokinase [Scytolyngbya sp. HA4215-MV1]|jgi:glucokinase|nr:glucokinase [Scytolyngbya sp. HA4215-MV1]